MSGADAAEDAAGLTEPTPAVPADAAEPPTEVAPADAAEPPTEAAPADAAEASTEAAPAVATEAPPAVADPAAAVAEDLGSQPAEGATPGLTGAPAAGTAEPPSAAQEEAAAVAIQKVVRSRQGSKAGAEAPADSIGDGFAAVVVEAAPEQIAAVIEGDRTPGGSEKKLTQEAIDKVVKRGSGAFLRRLSKGPNSIEGSLRRKSQTIDAMSVHDDAEEKQIAEEAKWRMPADFYYESDDPTLVPALQESEIPKSVARPCRFLGFDFSKHYNIVWTSETEFAYVTGHTVIIVNLSTDERRFLQGRDSGGVGCVSMSADQKHMVVAEKSNNATKPNIYIYEYDGLRLYRILRKGTERGYASVKFSPHNKSHIAALGMYPDYLLSVWDWRNERLLLKCKAYGQDVFNVSWGAYPGQMITCGTGHIRFWKMATTFTGLKLQGDIGKFGGTELSDVVGFLELPDGKIVSGSEYGKLLLWEGVFVKVELMRTHDDSPGIVLNGKASNPHEGSIDVMMMDASTNCFVSGGSDGFLRWWGIEEMEEAEPDFDAGILEYGITMRKEVRIPPENSGIKMTRAANIQHIARSSNDEIWLIQDDANGVIWRLNTGDMSCSSVMQTNAKAVTSIAVMSAFPGLVVTSGLDGTLRAFNMTAERDNELFLDRRGDAGIVCMSMAPESVDMERRTVSCGYSDGVIRTFFVCKDGFALVQACKPHNAAVTQIAYNADGTLMAVLAANNTIFFMEVRDRENQAAPLGFVQVPCQVNQIAWNDRGDEKSPGHLLLALEDGSITEICRPVPEMIDNTETYSIFLDYRAVRPELPEEDSEEEESDVEDDTELAEGEEPLIKMSREDKKEKRKKEKEAAVAAAKKPGGDDEEEKVEEIESAVKRCLYISDETVLFTGTGKYQGYLWEIPMQPAQIIDHTKIAMGDHVPQPSMCIKHTKLPANSEVTHLSISPSERFLFIGFSDGHVWVVSLANMQFFVDIGTGDATCGMVPSIATDSEEALLVAGGADGSLTAIDLNAEALLECAKMKDENAEVDTSELQDVIEQNYNPVQPTDNEEWEVPLVESPGLVGIPKDITDPNFYSIQDAKLKSEEENAKAAAERQKRRVRDRISEVRQELEEIQAKNVNIPYGQLTAEDSAVDPEYVSQLNREMEEKVEEVKTELSWSIEFHERGMQKLKDFFLGRVDFERIEVLAFSSPHRVSTFRTPSMSADLQLNLARLHELIFAADRESDDEDGGADSGPNNGGRRGGGNASDANKGSTGADAFADGMGSDRPPSGEEVLSGAQQRELRRQQRLVRKQQMGELEKSKPSDAFEDPLDVEAVAHAEATLGNYMLKTSDSYQVPENQRMNAEKKRRQMFLLEESMHAIKTEFNHRVLALRDFRQQVRAEVHRDLTALKDIDQQLGTATPWAAGLVDDQQGAPAEFPERRFDYSEVEMKAFARSVKVANGLEVDLEEAEELVEEYDPYEDEEGGEDADLGAEEEDAGDEEDDGQGEGEEKAQRQGRKPKRRSSSKSGGKGPIVGTAAPVSGRAALMSKRIERLTLRAKLLQAQGGSANPLGKAVATEAQARLWHDKMQLEEHVRQVIDTFDGAVASIEKEKAKLESDLKNADMKLLVLYEELLTLNELEEKDEELLRKATKCRQDKTSIMHQIKDCQDQLGEKKAEIEQWQNEETTLQAEFTELVGESSPFLGALLKIYKKKVKRSKRKKGGGDDEEFDDEEEEDEDESEIDSDEDVDDEDEDVGPPQGCDVQIYESVLDLREKRLDMEDALQEIQRAVDELKKTHKRLLEDERRIDKEQKQTDAEIQQFQTDKQRKLNQVEIVFALRLSQVQCLDGGTQGIGDPEAVTLGSEKLPGELDQHVVFTHEGLNRLMGRITELHQEIKDVKLNFQQLRKDYRLRKKEQKTAMSNIEDLQAKFQDIQMLKFGQIVDLDLIERSAPNKYVQELGEKVSEAERDHRLRLNEWEKRIEKQKKDLAKVTCDNTSLMEQIVSMGYSQMQLDAALNARIANVTVNDTEPLIELREMERERLKDLLTLQNKEIATLQAEINLFRKKGGHIYTTVTANRMPDQQQPTQ